ncbi:hypothetical protein PYCC9005_002263 [Savitreella phatthalungensis]
MPAASPKIYCIDDNPIRPGLITGLNNLQEQFELSYLAASVARVDAAGNKINKISKTYKRLMEQLGVPQPTAIPRNTFLLDLLLAGGAHKPLDDVGGYRLSSDDLTSFALRPGALANYKREGGSSATTAASLNRLRKSRGTASATAQGISPSASVTARNAPTPSTSSRDGHENTTAAHHTVGGTPTARSTTSRPPTGTTPRAASGHGGGYRSTPTTAGGSRANEGDEDDDEDDGSGFVQLDRDRQRKRQMRREIEENAKRRRFE